MEIGVLGGVGWSTPPSTLCGGGWMGLGAGPDGYKKKSHPHWDLNSRPFSI